MSSPGPRRSRSSQRRGSLRLTEPAPPVWSEAGTAPAAGLRPTLESVLASAESVLIYSHMNPDPDTVGAALGLRLLVQEGLGKKAMACYRGIIGRAENRQLMKLLGGEIVHARRIDPAEYTAALLVDCQPDYGFMRDLDSVPVVGVIDHHPLSPSTTSVPFADVRPDYGSTSTIVTEYLREAGLEPGPQVATALFYGVKTDTQDLTRRAAPPDVGAYHWLLPRIDRRTLTLIENPPLTRAYYEELMTAVGRAVIYQEAVLTELGWMAYPDMVAEIADRLIRLEGMEWSVCFGAHDQRIYLSVRTIHPTRDAGELVKAVLQNDGVGGGHDTMAAGRIQLPDTSEETYVRIVSGLWSRFLAALGEDPRNGRRMVSDPSIRLRVSESPAG